MTFRLQGTDGIRRKAILASDPEISGLTPQEAFVEKDALTEQFVELYLYCRVRQLIDNNLAKKGEAMAIAWDPRDPSGVFTDAAIRGIVKGGLNAEVLGILPTPGAPIYLRSKGVAAGAVITASHNPPSYNGIKIFTRRGLKLLPADDIALSKLVMATDYEKTVLPAPRLGEILDRKKEAAKVFLAFHLDPKNSWITDPARLEKVILILDTANGALFELAPTICKKAGFGSVIAINTSVDGAVNLRSGVGDLEGIHEITAEMIEEGGLFNGYEAIETLFEKGRDQANGIMSGRVSVSLASFDADGDRFMRADYNPYNDSIIVVSGDEISVHLAAMKNEPGKLFINTVESDMAVAIKATELGYEWDMTAVGDKWILLLGFLSHIQAVTDEAVFEAVSASAQSTEPSADNIEKSLDEANVDLSGSPDIHFCVGAEESGHITTPGYTDNGIVIAGNGLKTCLNTFAAEAFGPLSGITDLKERFYSFVHPYPRGFKKSLSIFHINKSHFYFESDVWNHARDAIIGGTYRYWSEISLTTMTLPQEPNMLYFKIMQAKNHVASIFIRNSGTEDKIGITLRGPAAKRDRLLNIGEEAMQVLLLRMKAPEKRYAIAERELLYITRDEGVPMEPVAGLSQDDYDRLLIETSIKQGLIDRPYAGALLTKRGVWYLKQLDQSKP